MIKAKFEQTEQSLTIKTMGTDGWWIAVAIPDEVHETFGEGKTEQIAVTDLIRKVWKDMPDDVTLSVNLESNEHGRYQINSSTVKFSGNTVHMDVNVKSII